MIEGDHSELVDGLGGGAKMDIPIAVEYPREAKVFLIEDGADFDVLDENKWI